MRFKIQVVIEDEQGITKIQEVLNLEKSNSSNDVVGLSLLESKEVLKKLQESIVLEQSESYTRQHKCCPLCAQPRTSKGYHLILYRTLFGVVSIPNLRLNQCSCHESLTATVSVLNDWLPEREDVKVADLNL
jgi:hypothetical protein